MIKKYIILVSVCLGTVLSAYLSSCINIALPNIMAALNFSMDSVVWVSLSYILPFGSILPLTGKLGIQFGAKRVYLIGLIIFTVASMLCGMATSSASMILFRIIQGIGGGMLLPNAMTIVVQTFETHERGQALGLWSAMTALGSSIGPTIGGYLIEVFDWRTIFFSVGPLCVISILFAFMVIPDTKPKATAVIDYLGSTMLIISISSLLVALNQGQKEGWDSLYIISFFYTSFATFVLFIATEFRVKEPMIDMNLFKNLTFTLASVIGFLTFFGSYALNYLMPFFFKSDLGYNSTTAGMMMLPMTVAMMIFSPLGGRLSDRFGSRLPAFSGMMVISYALYMLNTVNLDYSTNNFFIPLSLFGIGMGLTMSPLTNCAVSVLPIEKVGVGSGVFNMSKIIGGSIGVIFAETLMARREIYHSTILKEYLNPDIHSSNDIFQLIQSLWGNQGMNSSTISTATHGWLTGHGLLPQQYVMFKVVLNGMISRQASVLSFQDVFFVLAIISFTGGLLALIIKRRSVDLI